MEKHLQTGERIGGDLQRGAIYVRGSVTSDGSIVRQMSACETWAKAHGVDVQSRFVDDTAGDGAPRTGLAALPRALAADEVDVVIASAVDRLFRRPAAALAFIEDEIFARGIHCVFAAHDIHC